MRNLVVFFIGFLFGVVNLNADIPKHSPEFYEAIKPEVREAQRKGAEAKIVYRVVDDEGMPITNTIVHGIWQNDYPRKIWKKKYVTDKDGVFVAEQKIGGKFGCVVKKEGFYSSCDAVDFHWRKGVSPVLKDGKWQPYGERRTLVVKRIKNPIESSRLWYTVINVPSTNMWMGLDLESFKWVKPFGDGVHADILLRFNSEPINRYTVNWATMEISFTNNLHGGFYVKKKDFYSEMKSEYCVDTNAVFNTGTIYRIGRDGKDDNILDKNHYMVFRTRTKVDEKGNLISAHYGKIYGRWGIWGGTRAQLIFFNTNLNDINIEDLDAATRVRLKQNGLLK